MDYNTYFSNQEWDAFKGDVLKLIANKHELTDEYAITTSGFLEEGHGIIVSYSIYLAK
jgi:hypothetical protein